jgi:predicted permease
MHIAGAMSFLQDLHFGWRNLIRTPGFLIVAVLSLALGIGANTALFSLLYSAVYKALPVSDPQLLVLFNDPSAHGVSSGSSDGERNMLTFPEFLQLKQGMTSTEGLFAVQTVLPKLRIRIQNAEEETHGKLVSGGFFNLLRLKPQAGSFFDQSTDTQTGGAPVAVISDQFWTRRFGRDPSAIGKTFYLQKTAFTIVGVTPREFYGETVGENPDFWLPMSMQMQAYPGHDFLHDLADPTVKVQWIHVFGRLAPGANMAMAQTQASAIFKRSLEASYQSLSPDTRQKFMHQWLRLRPAANGASDLRDDFAHSMLVIFAAVAATLLICCANLSNLLLARANARQREITVRLALGAKKSRVVRQLFTEGLLLSFIGAAVGILLAQAAEPLLMRMAATGDQSISLDASLDWRVLLFTAVVAIATTIVCSLTPALRAARVELVGSLREGARGMTASQSRMVIGRAFVAAQIALSLILLIGAGLFLRTLMNLRSVNLGYKAEQITMMELDVAQAGYKNAERPVVYQRVLEKIRSLPGVEAATYSGNGLFSGSESNDDISVEGYTPKVQDDKESRFDQVGPGYFSSLGIPLLLGREINERDVKGTPMVCVINEAFAKKFFEGRNPLGKHITDEYGDKRFVFEIVGVARNSRDHSLKREIPPRFFLALQQGIIEGEVSPSVNYEVRSTLAGAAVTSALRQAVQSVDLNLKPEIAQLSSSLERQVGQERLIAKLVAFFGALALCLAAVGIYGILAYSVSQRTNEIGIRMAIGAEAGDVVGMIARETVAMVLIGLSSGLIAAYFITKLIQNRLFGVTSTDPVVLATALGLLALIAMLAGMLPAWRASRIDPAIALRYE